MSSWSGTKPRQVHTGGGDFMNRPGMVALLSFLDVQPEQSYIVIFDDLKRFARDTRFHLDLRDAFRQRGARIECLNFKFEETPEGEFIETIMAAQGALEREQNKRQVVQKMQARMKNGYWVFRPPIGYVFGKEAQHGKILVRNEPIASIVQEALEGYASGRFETQIEVARFLEGQPAFPKTDAGTVRQFEVTRMLLRPIYAGYICHDDWKLSWIDGHHEPLISLATYERIQERRNQGARAPARKDINEDFPLRGFVECGDCGKPLTACWSKGKYKKYPYYLCGTKGCKSERKSIPRAKIEEPFDKIMQSLQPTQKLFTLVKQMFRDAWTQREKHAAVILDRYKKDIKSIDTQIEGLLDRIVATSNSAIVSAYEGKIEKLDQERRVIAEKFQNGAVPKGRFEDFIELPLNFLANPWNLWKSGQSVLRQTVLRLAFSERIAYCRETGYRTPKTTLPFKALSAFDTGKMKLVEPEGYSTISLSHCVGATIQC